MKITRLSVFTVQHDASVTKTRYASSDKLKSDLETNIIKLETDSGLVGWGETCPAPSYYLPILATGARAAIAHVTPLVLGQDCRNCNRIMNSISTAMRGQYPARSALDMALRDLHAKALGAPLVDVWGGRVCDKLPVMCMVNEGSPEAMLQKIALYRSQGYKLYQLKIGTGSIDYEIDRIQTLMTAKQVGEQFFFDPNRAWSLHQAMAIIPQVIHLSPLIEQPCESYLQCRTVAERCGISLILDEVMSNQEALIQACQDGIIRVSALKMNNTGGLAQQRQMAQLAMRFGVSCRFEDYHGTGITLAAVTHLAQSLPAAATFALYNYVDNDTPVVHNPLVVSEGYVSLPEKCLPGLGVEVNEEYLSPSVAEYTY